MEILGIIAVIVVIVMIRGAIETAANKRRQQELAERIKKGLTVQCRDDTFTPSDGGEPLPLKEISVSGPILVPRNNYPASLRIRLLDITHSESKPHPLFCMISDLCDEYGMYAHDQTFEVPYAISEINELPVAKLPLFAFVGPHRGRRKVHVGISVTDPDDLSQIWASGTAVFTFEQEMEGYVEASERTKKREKQIATLALAISAADGHVDKRETTVIRRFFAERYAGSDNPDEWREKITETLQNTLSDIKRGTESPDELVARICNQLRGDDDPAVAQTAYELCVQVVAADEGVDQNEERALSRIAEQLALPDGFLREIRERNLRLSMYDEAEDEELVGMPSGLSKQEKVEFLNNEYRKWRSRATHRDPDVASEATLRMERIAKLRRHLTDA